MRAMDDQLCATRENSASVVHCGAHGEAFCLQQVPTLVEANFRRPNTALQDTTVTGSLCPPVA